MSEITREDIAARIAALEAEGTRWLFDQFIVSITKGQRGLPDDLIKDGVVDYEKIGALWEEYRSAAQPLTTSERAELENYRNAQQVVPGELSNKSFEYIANKFQVRISDAQWILVGWNACRAAMLQAGAVKDERPAYEVGTFGMITIKANGHSLDFDLSDFDFKAGGQCKHDGGFIWKNGLQGIINAIQAHCDSLPNGIQGVAIKWDSENPPVAMQSGEVKDGCDHEWVHHVPCLKPEYDQCSKCNVRREMFENCWVQNESQAGNSPVIPDGWVACSERMPSEDGLYLGYGTLYDDAEPDYIPAFFGVKLSEWIPVEDDCVPEWVTITHWMSMPSAPQQEASK